MKSQTTKFTIKNYGKESTFTNFLPGISGIHGIPIWCFYVNRGQCVTGFGVQDKDHAIMEFYPAHQGYQNVKRTGFRTFLKIDGKYIEPFSRESQNHNMNIYMNSFEIEEIDEENGIHTLVSYYGLPGEKVGGLVRKLTVRNISSRTRQIEILDGMPSCIPYGVDLNSMKGMGQTIKAWMQVEDIETALPYYRVRVSTEDRADVKEVEGGNFSMACLSDGTRLQPIVDPDTVFAYDTGLSQAVGFIEKGLEGLLKEEQVTQNKLPSSFYGSTCQLEPQEEVVIYQLIGQVDSKNILNDFMKYKKDGNYFEGKRKEAEELTEKLCSGIKTKTASADFDAYCQYTYLDNVLRGGYPIKLGRDKVFYVYSRKHGDPERDYNYFTLLPEFYSQGNGNFRDVNQNRRCDTFFAPFVGRENIKMFYSLIQLDGYNPLAVEKISYRVDRKKLEKLWEDLNYKDFNVSNRDNKKNPFEDLVDFLEKPFTPGSLYKKLDTINFGDDSTVPGLFEKIIGIAKEEVNSNFGEGYWSDHWTYNLDLIENYLDIFPEKEEKLLFEEDYTYFLSQVNINPRYKRYRKTPNGIRQYQALNKDSRRETVSKLVCSNYGKGEILYTSLMEKLLVLCVCKFSTLDAYGMGVEMEGGKPGWYDALNGLPGIFGSSMAETYELARNLDFTIKMLCKYPKDIKLLTEIAEFITSITVIVNEEKASLLSDMEIMSFWNKINDAKELYREKVYHGVLGKRESLDGNELAEILKEWRKVVQRGIEKACSFYDGICPTYFSYIVTDYEEREEGIIPKHFELVKMPLFLEGPVRYLRLGGRKEEKEKLYNNIKKSDLYDNKLSMYKVNASLEESSYEIGRAKAFTPGWLENESIWMHMEYKYLLELLKSGMYKEFYQDLYKAAVPFLDPKIYGRSIYENSSFIASSKNPNEKYHGKGFVARLSGSTIEFINMWKIMMFGKNPFFIEGDELALTFQPAIPEYLIGGKDTIFAKFLSHTNVEYILTNKENSNTKYELIPGNYQVISMECFDKSGDLHKIDGSVIKGDMAKLVRNGEIVEIKVYIDKKRTPF